MSQLFRTGSQTTAYTQIFGSTPQFASLKMRFIGDSGDICSNTSNTNEFVFLAGSGVGYSDWHDLGIVDLSKIYVKAGSVTSSWYAMVNTRNTLG